MKKNKIFILIGLFLAVIFVGCSDMLNLTPTDTLSESVYFRNLSDFQAAANNLHTNVYGWLGNTTYPINFDYGSDINPQLGDMGSGNNVPTTTDTYWTQTYGWLRTVNILLEKASEYKGTDNISVPIGQAYFFRAWHHFFLLKRFGGVPIVTKPLDVTQTQLPRNSRYEVMTQITADLDSAISRLQNYTVKTSSNDGHVTLEAAWALKARVCLFEGTWEKYVRTTTDGDGTTSGAGSKGYNAAQYTNYLNMAQQMAKKVIDSGNFALWKGVENSSTITAVTPNNYLRTSYYYLFNLEDAKSNPAGLTKASNTEAIFRSVYDVSNRPGNTNLTHTVPAGPTRKLMDMFLCTDGLPIQDSPLFQGYSTMVSEFANRDYRLTSTVKLPFTRYWGYGTSTNGGGANYTIDINSITTSSLVSQLTYVPILQGANGYVGRKFATENPGRQDYQESADYYQIRLAEVYLIYAEATCELNNGAISDADLNYSINLVRARAGVAPLTNALVAAHSDLTLLGEIRRERALELFGEGQRIADLCRWGIAQQELDYASAGAYVQYNGVNTEYVTAMNPFSKVLVYNPISYPAGFISTTETPCSTYSGIATLKPGAVITEQASNRHFALKNYLQPLPTDEIHLDPLMKQNPSW
ncbi:MAG: RagB/SusD family nutrient uptake outer membrane protein [Paludibacter sp.]|nr:RagB/SusD family nutrient uptake outer membrane protein [Paludibacter sp.]